MMDENTRITDALDQIDNNYHKIKDLSKELTSITNNTTKEAKNAVNAVLAKSEKSIDQLSVNMRIDSNFIPDFINGIDNTQGLDSYKEIEKWVSNNKELFQEKDSSALIEGAKLFDNKYISFHNQVSEIQERSNQEAERIRTEAQKTISDATASINGDIERLKSENEGFNLLHEDYYYLARDISKIIKTRRADNVTDALNLAIKEKKEEDYRKRQLKIQTKEAEDRNRMEEERNRILKEQAEKEAQHNKIMQQIAREKMEDDRRHQAEMLAAAEKANAMQEQQYNDNKRAMENAERARERAEWAERQRNNDRLQLQKALDRATSQWRSYKSQGLEQDAILWEAEIERIKGKLHSL